MPVVRSVLFSFAFFVLFCGYSISCLTFAASREFFRLLVPAPPHSAGRANDYFLFVLDLLR
jgi:hypothetical protein